jgi:hypothetical protein
MGLARGLAWAGIIWCCFLAFWLRSGFAWAPVAVVGVLCVAFLIFAARHDKRVDRTLPESFARLAYRSDEKAVAFAWLWRRGQQRVRVLRSDARGARRHDDAGGDQVCVFDRIGDGFVDDEVAPRRSYHYSLFVEDEDGAWSDPVLQTVLTYPAAERAALEASYAVALPPTAAERTVRSWRRRRRGPLLGDSQLVDAAADVATEAIFAVAGIFARDKPADGWQEIS